MKPIIPFLIDKGMSFAKRILQNSSNHTTKVNADDPVTQLAVLSVLLMFVVVILTIIF